MAVYRTDLYCADDCASSVQRITCDPPFVFGEDDVVTVVLEAIDPFSGEPVKFNGGDLVAVQFGSACVYFKNDGIYSSIAPDRYGSPCRLDIRRSDLYWPYHSSCAGMLSHFNGVTNPTSWNQFEAPVTSIVLAGENPYWNSGIRVTIITPDGGGVPMFWTGFKGCGELD